MDLEKFVEFVSGKKLEPFQKELLRYIEENPDSDFRVFYPPQKNINRMTK